MTRLVVSLLAVVFTSIFLINTISESIWHHFQPKDDPLSLARLVVKETQKALADKDIVNYDVLPLSSFAWLEEQQLKLNRGEIVELFGAKGDVNFYFKVADDKVVQLGPYSVPESPKHLRFIIYTFSYLMLVLCLVMWLRPLWRDLAQLTRITTQLSRGELELNYVPIHFSAIAGHTQEIQKLASKVAGLLENQKQLVNAVSHELRTPLARLKFALAMENTKNLKHGGEFRQNIADMETLIEEMLSYARLEMALQETPKKEVDLKRVLLMLCDKFTEVRIDVKFNEDKNCLILGDEVQLERLFSNLITNAIKYGNGQVLVTVASNRTAIVVTVEDDGQGIALEDVAAAFEPFNQLSKHRNSASGFGLGLAIVKRIATQHNATCAIHKSHLGGAKVVIEFAKA